MNLPMCIPGPVSTRAGATSHDSKYAGCRRDSERNVFLCFFLGSQNCVVSRGGKNDTLQFSGCEHLKAKCKGRKV